MKPALVALATAGLALLLLALAGPMYRIGILALPSAFGLLRWAAYLGIVALIVAVAAGAWAYFRRLRLPFVVAALGLLVGLVALAIPYRWQRAAQSVPPIHDISTDLENPPAFKAVIAARQEAPNGLERTADLADQQRTGYPDIEPLTLSQPRDQVFDRAMAVIGSLGWEVVNADKASGIIEATDTTTWFGFKDDIAVRLTPWGSGTRVDVRSVSRVGVSDVGTNARRIREFFAALRS
jgi:uncharacterized protein (DUF1499 family)